MSNILNEPVRYFPLNGEMERLNPVPERAVEARIGKSGDVLAVAGLQRIDWNDVKNVTASQVRKFLNDHKIRGDLPETMLAGNYKTNKPRAKTGRLGKIVGLNLMPHYYANILNRDVMDPLSWNFDKKDEEDEEDEGESGMDGEERVLPKSVRRQKEEIRRTFNSFNGESKKTASLASGVSQNSLLNFCVGSSAFCRSTCLVLTGQHAAAFETSQKKLKLTYAFLTNPVVFVAALDRALSMFACQCKALDFDPVVRLNMLSDIPWYALCPQLFSEHEDIAYYDYTKVPFWKGTAGYKDYKEVEGLLDLTFSYNGENKIACERALNAGHRVAAVFASTDPERVGTVGAGRTTFKEIIGGSGLIDEDGHMDIFGGKWLAVDGDESDYRIDDPSQSIVCLNFKAPNLKTSWNEKEQQKLEKSTGAEREKMQRQYEDVQAYGHLWKTEEGEKSLLERSREAFSLSVPHTGQGYAITKGSSRSRLWSKVKELTKNTPNEGKVKPSVFSPEQLVTLGKIKDVTAAANTAINWYNKMSGPVESAALWQGVNLLTRDTPDAGRIRPDLFTADQLADAFEQGPIEGAATLVRWYAQIKEVIADTRKGIAMQPVVPSAKKKRSRKNGAEGLLIGPHVPTIVND